jgi:hypothetical protein
MMGRFILFTLLFMGIIAITIKKFSGLNVDDARLLYWLIAALFMLAVTAVYKLLPETGK